MTTNQHLAGSTSHISLMMRPFGAPRIHMDENAASAPANEAPAVATPAAPESFNSPSGAAKFLAEQRWNKEKSAESAGHRNSEPDTATAETELAQANTDPEAVLGETQEADPAAEPPIERPRSWSKDDDDDWAALPRARQEKIAANERAREADINRRINDAAEKLKGLTVKEQEAEQEKRTYQGKLPALMQALQDVSDREFPDIKSIADYERYAMEAHRLSTEDPFKSLQIGNYLKAFDAHQQKLVAVNAELQKAEGEKRRATEAELDSYKNAQDARFIKFAPELAAPAKKAEIMEKAVKAMTDDTGDINDIGFTRDELNEFASNPVAAKLLFHSGFQKLVYNYLKFSDLKAAPAKAVPKDLPPVVRPGTSKPSGGAVSERVQALDSKLTNSGSLKDAQALLLAKRNSSRRAS